MKHITKVFHVLVFSVMTGAFVCSMQNGQPAAQEVKKEPAVIAAAQQYQYFGDIIAKVGRFTAVLRDVTRAIFSGSLSEVNKLEHEQVRRDVLMHEDAAHCPADKPCTLSICALNKALAGLMDEAEVAIKKAFENKEENREQKLAELGVLEDRFTDFITVLKELSPVKLDAFSKAEGNKTEVEQTAPAKIKTAKDLSFFVKTTLKILVGAAWLAFPKTMTPRADGGAMQIAAVQGDWESIVDLIFVLKANKTRLATLSETCKKA